MARQAANGGIATHPRNRRDIFNGLLGGGRTLEAGAVGDTGRN